MAKVSAKKASAKKLPLAKAPSKKNTNKLYTETLEEVDARKWLHKVVKPGDVIYTKKVFSNANSTQIHLECFVPAKLKGEFYIANLTWAVGALTGYKKDEVTGGLIVGGITKDKGKLLVEALGAALYGVGPECALYGYPSTRPGQKGPETDGDYMLRHRWL